MERGENEKGSGISGTILHPSEDEVFADAASNFADITSSTVTEAASENALESESTIKKVKEDVPALGTATGIISMSRLSFQICFSSDIFYTYQDHINDLCRYMGNEHHYDLLGQIHIKNGNDNTFIFFGSLGNKGLI